MRPLAIALAALLASAAPVGAQEQAAPAASLQQGILQALARARRGLEPPVAGKKASAEERFLAALAVNDDDAAWPLFKRLAVDFPTSPLGEIGMARVYVRWRIREQAEAAFARAWRLAPGHPVTLVERAIFRRESGERDAARADAQAALAQDPGDARALAVLAGLFDDAGAPVAERKAAWAEALARSADLFEAKFALLAIAEAEGDAATAARLVEELAAADPDDLSLQRKLAKARRAAGDRAGEAAALEAALQLGDANKETLVSLAQAFRAQQDAQGEERALRRIRRVDPKDRGALLRLYNLKAAAKDEAGMEEMARGLLVIDPKDASAHLALSLRAAARGDVLGQLEELEAAAAGTAYPEARGAPERARDELSALRGKLMMPERALVARSAQEAYQLAQRQLTRMYEVKRAEKPELRGRLALRLKIGAAGKADLVEVTEDELGEPDLANGLTAWLKAGSYPKEAKTLSLKFDLAPPGSRRWVERAEPAPPPAPPPPPPQQKTKAADLLGP